MDSSNSTVPATSGFYNAGDFGFSPNSQPEGNVHALQKALDQGGTIVISQPGTYEVSGTVYIGSNTTLKCGNGVILKKVVTKEKFTHVLLNKGALTKTYDHNIVIEGLQIMVNGVDKAFTEVYGLRGQLAFFYAKDVRIERFRCYDLEPAQFCIHVCTFEDLIINDVIIKGDKDGVHLGRGKRFTISNGVFHTYDDAVALNAHDYATSNPELGWLEDGVVCNCYDLPDGKKPIGFFSRILAGGWIDWQEGMEVQHSDSVVSDGRLYRVQAEPDGTVYKSVTKPEHPEGKKELDGIPWVVVQNDVTYTAGVRNVTFRDIFLEKSRVAFSIHFDMGRYSRSYYPGAEIPIQQQLKFDNINMLHGETVPFLKVNTPVDVITLTNSSIRNNQVVFFDNSSMSDYLKTRMMVQGCSFNGITETSFIDNRIESKELDVVMSGNVDVGT